MRIWIRSLNQCRLLLQYDIHLDDSLIPDEQVMKSHHRTNFDDDCSLERTSNQRKQHSLA